MAGTVLWVYLMGGMMSHAAPASAATMTPLHCSIENTCTFNGLNGTFEVTTAGSLAWMSHAGGWLECAGGPTGSVRATVRVPGYGPITYGYSANDSGLPSLAVGDGYLAVDAQFRGRGRDRPVTGGRDIPHRPSVCAMNLVVPKLGAVVVTLTVTLAICTTASSRATTTRSGVPAGFLPQSVSAVSATRWWVLGSAPCPGTSCWTTRSCGLKTVAAASSRCLSRSSETW